MHFTDRAMLVTDSVRMVAADVGGAGNTVPLQVALRSENDGSSADAQRAPHNCTRRCRSRTARSSI